MTANSIVHSVGRVIPMPKTNLLKKVKSSRIAIYTQGKIDLIDIEQIAYLKSDSNYTEVHLVDGSTIITSTTLKKYEAKLNSPKFMRVHNSYIIQRAQIKSFLQHEKKIILHNSQEIPVSRSRKETVMNYLKAFMI